MSYNYLEIKPNLFTEEGQKMFLDIRDHVNNVLNISGCIFMGKAILGARGGDSWLMMACVDRMAELGEIHEIDYGTCAGQHRIFVNYKV